MIEVIVCFVYNVLLYHIVWPSPPALPLIHRGLGFLENYRRGNQDVLVKMMAVVHIGGLSGIIVMYVAYKGVVYEKSMQRCLPQEFIFVFIRYFTRAVLSENSCQKRGDSEKVLKRWDGHMRAGGGGFQTFSTLFIIYHSYQMKPRGCM